MHKQIQSLTLLFPAPHYLNSLMHKIKSKKEKLHHKVLHNLYSAPSS